jgi:TonB family protein
MWIPTPLRAPSRALVTAAMLMALSHTSLVLAQAAPQAPPAAAPAAPVPAPKPVGLKVKLTTLEEWDTAVDNLTTITAVVYNSNTTQDLGGHNMEYYWQRNILTAATKEKLETLRDKAQKQSVAKDTAGLQKTLDEASAIFSAEQVKVSAITTFLYAQQPVVYHQYQLGPWLTRATDADRAAINDKVAATYDRLSQQLDAELKTPDPTPEHVGGMVDRFYKLIAEPVAFFNSERARLVKAQAEGPSAVAVPPRTRGDKACPAPTQPTKGRNKPALAPDFPSSESFYPAAEKQNDVQGAVTLRVAISETGCIQRAEVAGTSGVARLDEAALDLAMAGNYVPAAGAGDKATAGTMMFRVKFEQPDPFGSTP